MIYQDTPRFVGRFLLHKTRWLKKETTATMSNIYMQLIFWQ